VDEDGLFGPVRMLCEDIHQVAIKPVKIDDADEPPQENSVGEGHRDQEIAEQQANRQNGPIGDLKS